MNLDWIHNNNWNKIKTYIMKHKKDDYSKPLINGNNILHLAAMSNQHVIIMYLLKHDLKLFDTVDRNMNNILHLLSFYGNNTLLIKLTDYLSHLLNSHNVNGNTPLFNISDHNTFKLLIKKYDVNLNVVNKDNHTLLTFNIMKTKTMDDDYYKNFELLVKHKNINLNIPTKNLPLHLSISMNKYNIFLLLIKHGANTEQQNTSYTTPLLYAILYDREKMIKKLVSLTKNINYTGPENDINPLNKFAQDNNKDMVNFFIDKGFDINTIDTNHNTTLHTILMSAPKIDTDLLIKLIYKGDLTIQNVDGVTPLHIICSDYKWENFSEVLKNKKLSVFIKDNYNRSPFSFIKNNEVTQFMDIVSESYINQLKNKNDRLYKKCKNINKLCLHDIQKRIIQTRISYPLDDIDNFADFVLVEGINTNIGKFNSNSYHNVIYTYICLKKHKNLAIPFKFNNSAIKQTEYVNTILNLHKSPEGNILNDILYWYHYFMYEISPYIIFWKSKNIYYIDNRLNLYIQKLFNAKNIRYIYFKLTLLVSTQSTHANIILYDKNTGIMERFDPVGTVPYLDADDLDNMLYDYFNPIMTQYNKKFIYLAPKDFMGNISFQALSNDSDDEVKRLGDPIGYCLSWTFWYVDMRISNPDLHPKKLIEVSIKKIINNTDRKNIDGKFTFINFIRKYAAHLDAEKNSLMKSLNVKSSYIYNLIPYDDNTLLNKLSLILNDVLVSKI